MKREPDGLIYTILIEDKAVVALEARGSEARELCKEEWFLEDLCGLKSHGEPLYTPGQRLRARPATEEEWVRYDVTNRASLPKALPDAEWTEDAAFNAGEAIFANPLLKEVYKEAILKGCAFEKVKI